MSEIKLGDRVRDKITGLKGIVTSRSEYLYGCVRYGIQPEDAKDGKPAEVFGIDEPQVELIKASVIKPAAIPIPEPSAPRRHGPRADHFTRPAVPRR